MKRWILAGIVALAAAAWYVPYLSAARFREPIREARESALGRRVKVGQVQFRLLPVPGFTVHDVVIGEDPAIGAEPKAYVTTLRARPRISALLGGALAFASVDLEDTSVNMTRADRGESDVRWNFASLMRPKLLTTFPSIHMIGGRINFKFGDTKSIFYLLNTDVDLWPPSRADGPWTLRVRAEPARTDRPARGFGSFVARGQWIQRDSVFTLDVTLEKSELGDMLTLVQGSESGLHGHIWGDAHLGGPLARVGLTGRVTVEDIHGWNQPPPAGALVWPLAIGGSIDIPGQVLELRATAEGKQSPLDLRYRVADYLGRPRWGMTALFNGMPLGPVLAIGRSLGVKIPADISLEGAVQGAVGYSMPGGVPRMDGQVQIGGGMVQVAGAPPLRVGDTQVSFAGSSIALGPAAITNPGNETATLEGSYDIVTKRLAIGLATAGMSIASLRRQISVAGAPLLGQATSGTWSGSLGYTDEGGTGAGEWRGDFHMKDVDIPFEAFNQPVHVIATDATIDEAGIGLKRLSLSIAGIAVQGEYRYDPAADHPHKFKLAVARADGEALEKLLQPTLHRGTFLNYAFNFGRAPAPDWMRAMHADGTIQAAALDLGPQHFTKIKAHVVWDGVEVRLNGLQGQLDKAAFAGDGVIDLAQRQPNYQITGRISGVPWRSGTVEADGSLKTSGTGTELLSNMTAEGDFRARRIDLASLETWDTIQGQFAWAWNLRSPKLKLTELVMSTGGDTFTGTAETQNGGQLVLRISDGSRRIQAAG
ncbi:MAG: hypothetical protein M3N54_07790, partial [Acidobacteriota bacterium]|nr:hypothetical protein [Acidobacteriota bacterium]